MKELILRVENLSKVYRLGTIGTGSLRQDLMGWWTTVVLNKQNPFFNLIPKENDSNLVAGNTLWALRNVNFEVRKGEVLGIIGHNGSGKSTLLKILSRIVRPTSGTVKGLGKISSLLEVGTGFNPDLTGRENIYMSGYILGMSQQDVKNKFNEIVAFSGVEQFIDTPVKRYSSGMYMRLAFAVAAHLEPDILIIDEVLAVGDAEFQMKCLGKLEDASQKEGRTIIFVSHDLTAVKRLCTKVLWLEKGKVMDLGLTDKVISSYLAKIIPVVEPEYNYDQSKAISNKILFNLKKIQVKPLSEIQRKVITVETPILIDLEFDCYLLEGTVEINMRLFTTTKECVFDLGSPFVKVKPGTLAFKSVIPPNLLNDIKYLVSILILNKNGECLVEYEECISFKVEDFREDSNYIGDWPGIIRPKVEMTLTLLESVLEQSVTKL